MRGGRKRRQSRRGRRKRVNGQQARQHVRQKKGKREQRTQCGVGVGTTIMIAVIAIYTGAPEHRAANGCAAESRETLQAQPSAS